MVNNNKFDIKKILKESVAEMELKIKSIMAKEHLQRTGFFVKYENELPVLKNTYYKYKAFVNDNASFDNIKDISLATFYDICIYTDISADYLLGFIESKRKEQSANMVKKEFGLSDEAMEQLKRIKDKTSRDLDNISSAWINFILENDNFWFDLNDFLPLYLSIIYYNRVDLHQIEGVKYSLTKLIERLIDELCALEVESNKEAPALTEAQTEQYLKNFGVF